MERLTDEITPSICPNGHPIDPEEPVRGWVPCWCSRAADHRHGHRSYRCPTCRAVVLRPEHVDAPAGAIPPRRAAEPAAPPAARTQR